MEPTAADFFPALTAILACGDRWLGDGSGPPVTVHHLRSGQRYSTLRLSAPTVTSRWPCRNRNSGSAPGFLDDLPAHLDNRSRYAPASPPATRMSTRGRR